MSFIDQSAALEPIVKPLLEAANTELWKESLNILYLNGNVLAFSEEYQFPCIISARGPFEEVELSIDLLRGKTKVTFSELLKEFLASLTPMLITFFKQPEVRKTIDNNLEDEFIVLLMKKYSSDITDLQNELMQVLIQGASSVSDWITVEAFESLLDTREKMIRSAFSENEYEDMVDALVKLHLIEPRFQISLCPQCADYQITLSKTATITPECPKCGEEWASVTLFTFIPPYNEVKKTNSDLPLFLSSYLKHKIISFSPNKDVPILALYNIIIEDVKFDIDVYIPNYQAGIECKIFENASARMTKTRTNGIVGNLIPQIQRYFSVGIEHVVIVTNLGKSASEKVEKTLKSKLLEIGESDDVELIHKDIDYLLEWLDSKAEGITSLLSEDFAKSLGFDEKEPTTGK